MSCQCGCCDGIQIETPATIYNAPGHQALGYRVGTHSAFLESMKARLSMSKPLLALRARESDDPSIALLDCFAVVADVVSFYQERIANEGYLRTATEARSLTELAALVGYHPRPALGSTTTLAFTLDPDAATVIPAGSGARSVPGQNEVPQTFETSEDLDARAQWNTLQPAMTVPAVIRRYDDREPNQRDDARIIEKINVAGTSANLKAGDRLLFSFADGLAPIQRIVRESKSDFQAAVTAVSLAPAVDPFIAVRVALLEAVDSVRESSPSYPSVDYVVENYVKPVFDALSGVTPATPRELLALLPSTVERLTEAGALAAVRDPRVVVQWYETEVEALLHAARTVIAIAESQLRTAPSGILATRALAHQTLCPPKPEVGELAREASECDDGAALVALTPILPWLRRAPSRPPRRARDAITGVATLFRPDSDVHARLLVAADPMLAPNLHTAWANEVLTAPAALAGLQVLRTRVTVGAATRTADVKLDTVYDGILADSWIVIKDVVHRVKAVKQEVRTENAGGARIAIPCTTVTLSSAVELAKGQPVYAQGEALTVVGDPIDEDVFGDEIELGRVYEGLKPGRLLAITGERTDVPYTSGIRATELCMLAGVRQRVDVATNGSSLRTFLQLTPPLSYRYRRDTVTVLANVVEATQGETRSELLGGGDAGVARQQFRVRQTDVDHPLTFLPAANAAGAANTLRVAVSGVYWREAESLAMSASTDRDYGVSIAPDQSVRVEFGDGVHGARPATGTDNVTAKLRVGAGQGGNVIGGQVSQLTTRPLGVNTVTNPVRATGGTAADGPEDVREGAPLRQLALDRLVSVQDYEDFTRARAGIGKASARELFDGDGHVVNVTVAAVGDAPLDPGSGLLTTLREALVALGDVGHPVRVDIRETVMLIVSAGIKVTPDHDWDLVEPAVRAAVLDRFSFRRRGLAQNAYLSEAIATIQSVPGVDYVDVDVFKGIPGDVMPVELIELPDLLDAAERVVRARPADFVEERTFVDSEETLTAVAMRVGITVGELCALNPDITVPGLAGVSGLVIRRGIRPAEIAFIPPGIPEALTLRRIP